MQAAIITGASRGLGREIALEMDKYGYNLVLASRSLTELNTLKKQLKNKSLVVKTDVSKADDIEKMFEKTIKHFGRVDIVINNAGINFKKPFFEYTEKEYDYLMDVNTKSVFLSCKESEKRMKKGTFVVISSIAGYLSGKYYSVYSSSKHALEGFIKGARRESELDYIILHPYRLDTDFGKSYRHKSPKHRLSARYYAQYVVAKIRKQRMKSIYYFLRNHIIWLFKITVPNA